MMTEEDKERYVRWQNYRITHLSFSINLFLTFGVAALGFSIALLRDANFALPMGKGYLLSRSIYWLSGSVILGTTATLCRLWDFRCTALKIRKKFSGFRHSTAVFLARWLGGVSWSLFLLQLASLACGVWMLISAVLLAYADKLAR